MRWWNISSWLTQQNAKSIVEDFYKRSKSFVRGVSGKLGEISIYTYITVKAKQQSYLTRIKNSEWFWLAQNIANTSINHNNPSLNERSQHVVSSKYYALSITYNDFRIQTRQFKHKPGIVFCLSLCSDWWFYWVMYTEYPHKGSRIR